MTQKKVKKIILTTVLIGIMLFGIFQNMAYAFTSANIQIRDSEKRIVKDKTTGEYIEKQAYIMQRQGYNSKILWQLYEASVTGNPSNEIIEVLNTNYYCLNGEYKAGNEYTKGYNMVSEKGEIASLSGEYDEIYKNVVDQKIYTQLMWILDNMFIDGGPLTIEELLENAGIVKENDIWISDWAYGSEGYSEILSQEEVESVQEAALWYFTNYWLNKDDEANTSKNAFNLYLEQITNKTSSGAYWFKYKEGDLSKEKQEQAAILYDYFVDGAKNALAAGYNTEEEASLNLEYAGTSENHIQIDGSFYVIGPMTINTTGNVTGLGLTVKTGTNETPVDASNYEIRNSQGNVISVNDIVSVENFYVAVKKENFDRNVKITVDATGVSTVKTLWQAQGTYKNDPTDPNEEPKPFQPLVKVEKSEKSLGKTLEAAFIPNFDLALRKEIIAINGKNTANDIKNENKDDATRTINKDLSTIPNTATYKHRKDPVVVKTGDLVTYRIHIYNEGEVDGYASKIVDTLPLGLIKSSTMNSTVTSHKGNTYSANYHPGIGKPDEIELTLTSENPVVLNAFENNTLDEDYIDIICEVHQNPETDGTKHYLTNIAYIEEAYQKVGEIKTKVITRDRNDTESEAGNTDVTNNGNGLNVTDRTKIYKGNNPTLDLYNNTNNGRDYFAGQEDDDDFETVVVLPKEFDLKLIKFISAINGEASNRIVKVDTSNLKPNGSKKTTANYNVSKEPIMVETGDIVTYTLIIYNEGEISGYAEEITENIPEGLEFIVTPETDAEREVVAFNNLYGWNVAGRDEKGHTTVKTDCLSKNKSTSNLIDAYDGGEEPAHKEVFISLKVTGTDPNVIIRNEACISNDADKDGNAVTDRDSTPELWKKEDSNDKYDDNPNYPKYREDDEDYDNIKLARFDLALRKFISKVSLNGNFSNANTTTEYERAPKVDASKLGTIGANGKMITTAEYKHSKEPIVLNVGDYVLYTIRVYNEGDIDGYAKEITDYLPEYLDFIGSTTDEYVKNVNSNWNYDETTRKVTTKPEATIANTKLVAYKGNGTLSFADVQIICRINNKATMANKITNIAEISKYADENGPREKDIDSTSDNLIYPENPSSYKDEEIERKDEYIPGQEDDDDFEKVIVRMPGKYDVILIKEDENGEDLNSKATFEVNGKTKEVVGRLVIADDVIINAQNVDSPDTYVIKETIPPDEYCKFDGTITITANKQIDGMTYSLKDLVYVVTDKDGKKMDTTDAKVYLKNGNIYVEVINYEQKDFDLALRKFITDIQENAVTTRTPEVKYEDGKIAYKHPKDVVKVHVDDVIIYTLRVFNEGELAGFAEEITDDIPEYLEFLPENDTNKEYRWIMYDENGKITENVANAVKIKTDYTSKENGEKLMKEKNLDKNPNLLKEFDPNSEVSETNPAYVDVKVAFKVKDPNSNTYVITNHAQISEDADKDGNPVDDIDSIPDKWNDGEDDQDYENVGVEYFDLSLLKYVTKVVVTDNGKTTTTNTGNTGSPNDIIPKVEMHKKRVKTTVVKFEYTIKITNEGDIAGYAKEITDYVPKGLKFYAEDNTGWKDEGGNVISTKLLENTLLKPGESATVKVILRWINGEDNLQIKINKAEISEDFNDKKVPDRDSTPDNNVPGEDDIDDAPVLLGIRTGITENIIVYVCGGLAVLTVLGLGIMLIKKFVL